MFWGRLPYQTALKRFLERVRRHIERNNLDEADTLLFVDCDVLDLKTKDEEMSVAQTVQMSIKRA